MNSDADIVEIPEEFSHKAVFGSTGVGKSILAELLCEAEMINNGKKIVDLTNNRFLEGVSWCNPTRIRPFRDKLREIRRIASKPEIFRERGLDTEIFHPICSTLPKKLPPNFRLYTLPIDFFAYEEVLRVITNDSISDSAMISLIQHIEKITDTDSFSIIPAKIMESVEQKTLKTRGFQDVPVYFFFDSSQSASSANRPLLKVKNLGIFSSRNFPYVLDDSVIRESLKDSSKVTVFSTRFIDQRHFKIKLAINMYILMKLRDLNKGTGDTVVYIREARELFPNQKTNDRSLKVLGEQAESMAKDVRKAGITMLLDTQSPSDLPDGVLDQISTKYIFRCDKRLTEIIEEFRGMKPLDDERVKNIKSLRNHHFYVTGSNILPSINKFNGIVVQYKISDHLEKDENELDLLKKRWKKSEWFQTKPYLELLAKEWKGSTEKMGKKYEYHFKTEAQKSLAAQLGITWTELKVFRYLHRHPDKEFHSFTEVKRACGLAPSTANNALARMHDRGFVFKDKETNNKYALTETGKEFIKEHIAAISYD
jgi:DNA-binding MarR family transcriptional regulator